jgi:mercuric ion binding protein
MKKYQLILTALVFAFFAINLSAQDNTKSPATTDKLEDGFKQVKIQTTAECEMCKERIEKTLNKLSGVKSSNLDVPSKIATVVYKPESIELETIKKAINKVGYDADDFKKDEKAYKKLPACCKIGGHK